MIRSTLALALAVSLLVAACGGSAAAPAATAGQSPATTSAPASVLPSTGSALSPGGAGNGPALCAFLVSETPALQKAGSTAGALSVLAIDYANWIAADASRVLPDAAAMDTVTEASCPATRSSVLKLLGGASFAAAF